MSKEEYQRSEWLKDSKENYVYDVKISTRCDKIKLGEMYQAEVYLVCANKTQLPSVFINDSVGEKDWKINDISDTLIFDDYFNSFVYEILHV